MKHRRLISLYFLLLPMLGFSQLVLENLNNGRTKPLAGNRKTAFVFREHAIAQYAPHNFRTYTSHSFLVKNDSIEMIVDEMDWSFRDDQRSLSQSNVFEYRGQPLPTKRAISDLRTIKVYRRTDDFFKVTGVVLIVFSALDALLITPLMDEDLRSKTQRINAIGFGLGLGLVLVPGTKRYNIGVLGDPSEKMWGVLR